MSDEKNYLFIDGGYWLFAGQAAEVISRNSGHVVHPNYIRVAAARAGVQTREAGNNSNLYPLSWVEGVIVHKKPGAAPCSRRRPDSEVSASALRKRKFDERRREELLRSLSS